MDRTQDNTEQSRPGAGPSTEQNITLGPETGEFTTDKAPTTKTPANGSSNAGINERHGNRAEDD